MSHQFSPAQLPPELLSEIKQFEERLRADTDANIVLVAYAEDTPVKED
jgi:hypothetical protein